MKQKLSPAIDDYILHRRSLGKAAETIRSNVSILGRFLEITGNLYVENIGEEHIDTYFRTLTDSGKRSAASQGVDTATLKGFFKWALRTRRTRNNPIADREAPRAPKRTWRGIPVSKVPALLDAAKHPRDRMLLALGCYLIGRGVEFALLRVDDIDLDSGMIRYTIPKTYKTDSMPISTELDEELRRWLTWYTEACGPLDPHWYLVPAKNPPRLGADRKVIPGTGRPIPNKPISTPKRKGTQQRIAHAALNAVGFPTRDENGKALGEGMHTLRRSIARGLYFQLLDEGEPNAIEVVRAMGNWSTEKQVRDYIGLPAGHEVRNARIRGKRMFPGLVSSNVASLGEARERAELRSSSG
jgi:integrase